MLKIYNVETQVSGKSAYYLKKNEFFKSYDLFWLEYAWKLIS